MRENTNYWSELDDDLAEPRPRKLKRQQPQPKPVQVKARLAEELYREEDGFAFSYKAGRHEQMWISEALQEFHNDNLILDVLHMVRGGKEANVYCCQSHPNLGLPLAAAKIYRPRLLRNLKNDALYKEGRRYLDSQGKHLRDGRSQRAIAKKTRLGAEMIINSWMEYEHQTLQLLHAAGADVPRPVGRSRNAILMEYIGEITAPAPTLQEVRIPAEEARPLFDRVLHNIEILLAHHRIHADLSAYNVLYWEGRIVIIDFPQVVDPMENPQGYELLQRDIERICQYFAPYGVGLNSNHLASDLWSRYLRRDLAGM